MIGSRKSSMPTELGPWAEGPRHKADHERVGLSPGQRPTVAPRVGAGEQHAGRCITPNDLDAARSFKIADGLDRVSATRELGAHCVGKAPFDRQRILAVM